MARRVRVRGTRRQVWAGTRQKTTASGHSKADLMRSKTGKIVNVNKQKKERNSYCQKRLKRKKKKNLHLLYYAEK